MFLVQLAGGLGNQLFQYALGRRISKERNIPLYFDLTALEIESSYRKYKLDHFHIQGRPASRQELKQFYNDDKPYFFRKLTSLFQRYLPYYRRRVVLEQSLAFDLNVSNVPSHVSLQGYWQSEKYFRDIRSTLCEELSLRFPLSPVSLIFQNKIMDSESIGLHIRRGDYLANPKTNSIHGVLPLEYYYKAIDMILSHVQKPNFFVFSDDIPWAKQNMKIDGQVEFVEGNDGENKDCEDLALLMKCKHHVIANSSFSWWAAWLSQNPGKMVIAPRQWYQINISAQDLIPEEWIRI